MADDAAPRLSLGAARPTDEAASGTASPRDEWRRRELLAQALGVKVGSLDGLGSEEVKVAIVRWRRLEDLVAVDDLTGVLRRDAGMHALEREVARARRETGTLTLVFIDVDHLKRVNDTLGHAQGDVLLRAVGETLRLSVRGYDVVMRYGGDEFVLALVGSGVAVAERRVADLDAAVQGASLSSGLASLEPSDDAHSLIARADAALYIGRRRREGAQAP